MYYKENFYHNLSDLADDLDLSKMKPGDIIFAEGRDLEPIITVTAENLVDCTECLWEDRLSESADEVEKILKVFKENIDFEKLNAAMPKLWYPNGKKIKITYEQLKESLIQNK